MEDATKQGADDPAEAAVDGRRLRRLEKPAAGLEAESHPMGAMYSVCVRQAADARGQWLHARGLACIVFAACMQVRLPAHRTAGSGDTRSAAYSWVKTAKFRMAPHVC
ncbi:MAG TPA: hypothetical protein VK110_04005, partial [Salinisphaeraceae bacterium]|nr:hypothetical protein [Salinisphaeraceae bacterium]